MFLASTRHGAYQSDGVQTQLRDPTVAGLSCQVSSWMLAVSKWSSDYLNLKMVASFAFPRPFRQQSGVLYMAIRSTIISWARKAFRGVPLTVPVPRPTRVRQPQTHKES